MYYYRILSIFQNFDFDHPVALNEIKRIPEFRFKNWVRAFAVLGGAEFVFALPFCWIPFIHWLWRLPAILVGATVVSREVEDRTWHPLRVTPLSINEIITAKYAAIIRYMEPHITLVTYVRAVPVIVFAVAWIASTLTILPRQGLAYWFSTSVALLVAGAYLMISPVLDVAVDAAIGVLASTLSSRRSTALIVAMLARLTGWLLPLALAIPLQYGLLNGIGGVQLDFITLRAVAVMATFGPGYAFIWGISNWISVGLVVVTFLARLGLIRLMLELAIYRAARIDV